MKHWAIKLPSTRVMLLNGAAALVIGASLSAAVRWSLFAPEVAPCSQRHVQGVRMTLERNGKAMDISELQGQLGGTDWNLLDNARVVALKSGPAQQALEFKTVVRKPADGNDKPGIGFVWRAEALPRTAAAVCLAYDVFVPQDFDFAAGGRLPGLLGNRESDAPGDVAFSTRLHFDERGKLDVVGDLAGRTPGRPLGTGGYTSQLTPGTWTAVEQEIVLNTPGVEDGAVRVWINGSLGLERTGIAIRKTGEEAIAGVLADVMSHARPKVEPKQAAVWLSPFTVRWVQAR